MVFKLVSKDIGNKGVLSSWLDCFGIQNGIRGCFTSHHFKSPDCFSLDNSITPFVFFQKQKCELGWYHKLAPNPVSVKLLPLPKELPPQKKPAD